MVLAAREYKPATDAATGGSVWPRAVGGLGRMFERAEFRRYDRVSALKAGAVASGQPVSSARCQDRRLASSARDVRSGGPPLLQTIADLSVAPRLRPRAWPLVWRPESSDGWTSMPVSRTELRFKPP